MKVAIFQPTYLSWIGFYKAIQWADIFVILDDVQFEQQSWQHRNKIKTSQGTLMMTIPVVRGFPKEIKDVEISYSTNWIKKHLGSIKMSYNKANFFKDFFPIVENLYKDPPLKLLDFNMRIIKTLCAYLNISTKIIFSSELETENLFKNDKISCILKQVGATDYLYAVGAEQYMKLEIDLYQGVKLISLDFEHPVYSQLHGPFVSHLAIIDILFNLGREETVSLLDNIKI